MALEVEYMEDRGGAENKLQSHGYVYFNDNTRVGFAPGLKDQAPVWPARMHGSDSSKIGPRHIRLATEFLRKEGYMK